SGGLASTWPPSGPRWLATIPARRSSSRMLEELLRDALRLGEPLGGDGRAVAVGGELDERAHGVVDLRGDPHAVIVKVGEAERFTRAPPPGRPQVGRATRRP